MSSTKQYIWEISLEKLTAKNTNDGMLQFLALKLLYHYIAIRLKIVNHEEFEAIH